jgi:hypothetical protein
MSTVITLNAEGYADFMRCLTNFKDVCNDVDIKNGFIRQRSNNLACSFEINLTPVIMDANLPIINLKKKLDLLKIFMGQSVTIEIHDDLGNDSYFIVSDELSSLKFVFPTIEFIENKYMGEAELYQVYNLAEDNLILHDELSKIVTDRIRIISENFNADSIQVRFQENQATICTRTQSNDLYANFKTGLPLNATFEPSFLNISTIPFKIDHDTDVDFKMYKEGDRDISVNVTSTKLGAIEIKMFSRSAIIPEPTE